ncbi:hypothetical protein DFR52_101767 [Hoeflea marina]|uniref:Apple domain-containing protein n=1 Tax=Hoeflea marina TaxID=274592 RepID=A0A317PT30_9HYPH|nr:alpha-2-macroglobulin family protein [Hoeflea marina]PWW04077.1 hypothetical protein DFR52_101767 [Hoeflea marina]
MLKVSRFAALLLLIFAALPALAADGRTIETTPDSDYFGFDLRTVQNIGLDDCKAICLGDSQCKAFTYNTRAAWCFLKSDYNQINSFPGAVAGRVVADTGEPDIGAAPDLGFLPATSSDEARNYRDRNMANHDGASLSADALMRNATAAMGASDYAAAIRGFAAGVAADPERGDIWLELSRAANAYKPVDDTVARGLRSVAISSAINAYRTSRTATLRADALAALGTAFVATEDWRPALDSWRASLAIRETPGLRASYAELRSRKGFRVVDNAVDSDATTPRICVQFSEALRGDLDYAGYVSVPEAPSAAIEVEGQQICVDGLEHGQRYHVTLREGLPAAIDEALEAPVELTVYVRDRAPTVRFTGSNFVLPSKGRHGIPMVSINATVAHLNLYRVGERALTTVLAGSDFLNQLDSYSTGRLADETGEPVWKGDIEVTPAANKEVVTSIPLDEVLPERRPGVYVLTAVAEGDKSDDWAPRATQWFVVSDLGLSTFAGTDGLSVFIRSLESARPVGDVTLTLLARNNEVLGTASTNADGKAVFTAGLMRGTAGLAPAALLARSGEDDFVFLDLTRGGFDLSDRGVSGRVAPGAIDVMAWTERGIYRPGETVHLSALVRDDKAEALTGIPLTVVLQRPDGVEDRRLVSDGAALGGHALALALADNSMTGTWRARIFTDPDRDVLIEKTFLVEDFQPDRIEFDLTAPAVPLTTGEPATVAIDGRYLYGAPAAGLSAEGEVVLRRSRGREAFPGYEFGLADEEISDARIALDSIEPLDENGHGEVEVAVDEVMATTQFVTAEVTIRLKEAGGRAVERQTTLEVEADGDRIGIRPLFEGGQAKEGGEAGFAVIAVAPDGSRVAMDGAEWTLVRVERQYQWYRSGDSWSYEPVDLSTKVDDGTVDIGTDGVATISVPVGWGRYRLEIAGGEGAESSVLFDAGWYVAAASTETPDGLEIALDKDSYQTGDTARLRISPRFAGEVLVTVGAERLITVDTASAGVDGVTIDLPVTEDWGSGAYVTATLFRPAGEAESRMPARAIGVKWLTVEPGGRKLDVAIDLPAQLPPREPLRVPVRLAGLAGQQAYVSIAAVDVGILNLTRYETPDPESWYFGQRMLGLEIRDIYGNLIDGSAGVAGRIRTGGDGAEMRADGSPPKEKLVAFFEGPIEVDANGMAEVSFDLPQFNGTVRVSVAAWSAKGVGHAEKDIIVRDPVVMTASLPQFLTPGDESRLRVDFANTDAPAGTYQVALASGNGRVEIGGETSQSLTLAEGGRATLSLPLTGMAIGTDTITVSLEGPSGLAVSHVEQIEVRPSAMPVTTRRVVALAGNGGTLRIDRELMEGNVHEGAAVTVGVTRNAAFDVGSLLMALDRYPYGCAEQTTSRALPLLYLSELEEGGSFDSDQAVAKRINDAITRLVSYQSSSGSFGLWGPGSGDLWLDAYVTDFLTRAAEKGFAVPPEASRLAIDSLQNTLAYTTDVAADGSGMAYALYVLARNRKASASDLRYYSDTRLQSFSEPLARAQIGAALSLYGDAPRAVESFRSAFVQVKSSAGLVSSRSDYGSTLRDGAGILALASESSPSAEFLGELVGFVSGQLEQRRQTSTQENVWMVLAARALSEANRGIALNVNGEEQTGAYSRRMSGDELLAEPLTLVNRGPEPVDAVVTTIAAPLQPLTAGGDGFTIDKGYYTLEGEPVSISEVEQNQRFVVVLQMSEAASWTSRVIVTDLLPAGFVIDNPRLVGSAELSNMDWLGAADANHAEFRADRFVAAFDRTASSSRDFKAAYVVRAVSPGTYTLPAAVVENMYRPELAARTATGILEITAAP